jgi:hypothetical protein
MNAVSIKITNLHTNTGQIPGVPANPRFIKDEPYEKLKKSIQDDPEMLDLRELIVYPYPGKKGHYVIIGGNMRYRICKELGYKDMPTKIIPEDTPPEKLRAYLIKDNVAFGDWDIDLLANEWENEELADWGVDLPDFDPPGGDPFGDEGITPKNQFAVIVACPTEDRQIEIYNELTGMGYECKVVVV